MKYFAALFYLFILLTSYSQQELNIKTVAIPQDIWGIEGRFKSGFLLAHRGIMAHLPKHVALAGEISLYRKPSGNKKWHSSYRLPQHGVSIIGGSSGNNEVLGYFVGAYGFLELPLIKAKHFQLDWKLSLGLSYATKKYDAISNPKNASIGSNLNVLGCFGAKATYFFQHQKICLGLDMTHYSNGSFKVPNLGINIPFLSIGYGQDLFRIKKDSSFLTSSLADKKWNFGITAIYSAKQLNMITDNRYSVFALDLFTRKLFTQKAGIELAVNLMSNQSLKENDTQNEISQSDIFQAGIYAGYILPFDRLHFVFGLGAYIKNKLMPNDPIYNRIGLRYLFRNRIQAHFVLKAHYARADYFELGIGYVFNGKKQ